MKRQYLGDKRDLFKFDLIEKFIRKIKAIKRFTYILMLTDFDDIHKNHGNQRDFKNAIGIKNKGLIALFENYGSQINFDKIKRYFKKFIDDVEIYEEDFRDENRIQYFKNIPQDRLSKSLIFVDPDIGLQSKSPSEKHILYWEVSYLYDQMDKDSLLIIYQHSTHKKNFLLEVERGLETNINCSPLYISDKDIAFFFLTKNRTLLENVYDTLKKYKGGYNKKLTLSVNPFSGRLEHEIPRRNKKNP